MSDNDILKKLEEDTLYKSALAAANTDEERAKIRAHVVKMVSSFALIAEQIKTEQETSRE